MHSPTPGLTPGSYVRHPTRDDWGIGQIQSAIDNRITVNFENVGKQLIDANAVELIVINLD